MNRLRQFQKSCQSFQGVLFTGVRNKDGCRQQLQDVWFYESPQP